MKKILFLILIIIIPVKADTLDSYVVMDIDTGRVFKQLNKDKVNYPASTTKIMTALVAIENKSPMDVVKVGNEILTIDGSNIYTEIGENFLLSDLLYGMMLRSGNDASMVIAKNTGGSIDNFVKMMNQKVKDLKLKNTSFENPTGLDDNTKNKSTVYDMALIYKEAYKYPLFKEIVKTKEYKAESDKKSYYFKNKNKMLSMYDKTTGGKTGYTPKAGRLLVSSATSNDLEIVISSHGNGYGYKNHIAMYEEIFSNYKNYIILDKNTFKEKHENKTYYLEKSFSYPLTKEEYDSLEIKSNDKYIFVYLNKDLIHKQKLLIKENKVSFLKRIKNFFT